MDTIAVIGLGYVGLPLAVAFGVKRPVIGFDINENRIIELKGGIDVTKEVASNELENASQLTFTSNSAEIDTASIFIVTVPTPIDEFKKPDLRPLISASKTVGKVLKKGDLVIYESTVYPGCTEEVCVPILEQKSGLRANQDFHYGYSPERINPGDKTHRLKDIKKITSGSTPAITDTVDKLYQTIVEAGTYKTSSIKVAEAAKVIENAQRDLNIAFVNELALLFSKMGIDTNEVLDAAATKWNFLPFRPGLVGGHCIGVDPYYLTYKAESLGHHPEVILAGRRINDNMGKFVAAEFIKLISKQEIKIAGANVLILGITFKENCPDIRNSKVIDVINELRDFGINVHVLDPHANKKEVNMEYGIELIDDPNHQFEGIILAVGHDDFKHINLKDIIKDNGVLYDLKNFFKPEQVTARL